MPYEAEISRDNRTCFLFLIDQSGSMSDPLGGQSGRSKAQYVADAINRLLQNLALKCARVEGIRDYFEIGVIGYGAKGSQIASALGGALVGQWLWPVSAIGNKPLRVEDRTKQVEDGAGGFREQRFKFPVWVEPVAGGATPMCEALQQAGSVLSEFLRTFPGCFPPVVLNITDGEANDDPLPAAQQLTSLESTDGNVLLFNLHVSSDATRPIAFPSDDRELHDPYAAQLFHMSSILPPRMLDSARQEGFSVNSTSRGFIFDADAVALIRFLEIGTQNARKLR